MSMGYIELQDVRSQEEMVFHRRRTRESIHSLLCKLLSAVWQRNSVETNMPIDIGYSFDIKDFSFDEKTLISQFAI